MGRIQELIKKKGRDTQLKEYRGREKRKPGRRHGDIQLAKGREEGEQEDKLVNEKEGDTKS